MADSSVQRATLSVVTAIRPTQLSKSYVLNAKGSLEGTPGGPLLEGKLEVASVGSHEELAALLDALDPSQAIICGLHKRGATMLMSQHQLDKTGASESFGTRAKREFQWPAGGAVLIIDYDPPSDRCLSQVELIAAIRLAAPGLADARMTWTPSASSCIFHGEDELRGVRGQRLYLLVEAGTDIERAGSVLVARLWLLGYGRMQISKSGQLLERTHADAAIWQENRLDFAGGCCVRPPLTQRRGAAQIIAGNVEFVDTATALPDLSALEEDELARLKAIAKSKAAPEAESVKISWAREARKRISSALPRAKARARKTTEQLEAIAMQAVNERVLCGDYPSQQRCRMDLATANYLTSHSHRHCNQCDVAFATEPS